MKTTLIILSVFLLKISTFAQLSVTNGHTAQELANKFTGQSVNAVNCQIVQGNELQYGMFSFSGNGLDVTSGVILSTGNIFNAVGPNDNPATSYGFGGEGNYDLFQNLPDEYEPIETYDAVLFQFDFQVLSDSIEFEYIFLSEEYNEILGDPEYNDAFAFFISGPGIEGERNLAVIPGQSIPVTANTINNDSFWQLFHNNDFGSSDTNIEFDGFTTLMKAKTSGLIPCETYTLKLIIADGGDEYTDSGVLLKENSLSQTVVSVSTETYSGNNIAIESCINANFKFELDQAKDEDVEIELSIEGSAVNGVDYEYIDPHIIIPAGQIQATLTVKAINDGLSEGQESVYMIYTPVPCQAPDTAKLFIDDYDQIIFTADGVDATCNGSANGEININIEGGFLPYTFFVTDTLTLEQYIYTELPITGLDSGTYKLDVIDNYGCKAEDIVMAGEFDAGQTFLPDGNGDSYESVIEITGFQDGQTLESGSQLVGITAVMEHSAAMDLNVVLEAPNGSQLLLLHNGIKASKNYGSADLGEPVASGKIDDWNELNIMPGVGYEYTWNHNPVFGTMRDELMAGNLPEHTYVSNWGNTLTDYYFPAGSYTPVNDFDDIIGTELNGEWKIIVTDENPRDNGYIFSWNISLKAERPDSIIDISHPPRPLVNSSSNNPSCNQSNGSIDITVTGGNPDFSYLWNTGATTQDLSNIPSGAYDVDITDANNCVYNFPFNLSDNGGSLSLYASITNETCPDNNNGIIDLTAVGTEPINYSWSNGSTNEDINNLIPGNYTVIVSDGNNCNAVETYNVEAATEINITYEITDENCGNHEGIINISVAGGVQPYTFLWSNGATTEDVDELEQGDCSVTITDQNGCIKEQSFQIINYVGNCIPDCDLEITNFILTNETCGDANGAIDLTVFTSFPPYSVSWSNGAATDDINSLQEGIYSITITDAEGCELNQDYTIENQSGNFTISDFQTIDETCGNGTGSIDITVYGGAAPYSFSWSNGEVTEDISNLNFGNYSVSVTDANQCTITKTITINNNTGDLEQIWGNVVHEICGNSEGSIDIMLTGGTTPYAFLWSDGTSTEDLIGLSEGTYFCTITDNAGCSLTTEAFIVENISGTLSIDDIDVDNEICSNGSGEIELIISGRTEPYSFSWSNGATSQDIFNLSADTYSAVINDNNGCSVNTGDLLLINEVGTMELSEIIVTDEVCDNNSGEINITLSGGTAPYSFIWNNGNTAEDLTGLNEGNYSCHITDNSGCELDLNTTVNNSSGTLTLEDINITDENCGQSNAAIDITISGGNAPVLYNWNSGATTQDLSNIPVGNYTCTIIDNEGCIVIAEADVINNAGTLSLDNYALTNETCANADGEIDITVSGDNAPFNFLWSNGANTEDLTGLSAGEYSCLITDNAGCSITTNTFVINDFSGTLSINNISVIDEQCEDGTGSIDLSISGGTEPISYNWSNGENTEDISGLSAGTYTYTVTDNENCSLTGNVVVQNNIGTLNLDSYLKTDESCNQGNGSIDISVSGGTTPYTYSWNSGQTEEDIYNLDEGVYQVTITDNNNCQIISDNINIVNNSGDINIPEFEIINETCGLSDGGINITVENGTPPYSFLWNTGNDTEDIENIPAGNYTVQITDIPGCSYSETFNVENNSNGFNISEINITDEECGSGTGIIDINITGGTEPYTYLWSNGANTQDLVNLSAGIYTCIITDNADCSITENFIVNNNTSGFEVSVSSKSDDYCHKHNGIIDLNISGGTEPYSFNWSNGETTEDIENLWAGTYSVVVTDNSDCSISQTFYINNGLNNDLGINNIQITDDECGQNIGIIEFEPNVPGDYVYKIDNMINLSGEPIFENLGKAYYEISIHDAGCIVKEIVFVDNIADFVIDTLDIGWASCEQPLTWIGVDVIPQSEHYIYEWNTGGTEYYISDVPEGTYTCIVTDTVTGCIQTGVFEILNETEIFELIASDITNETCSNLNGAIDIHGMHPYFTYTYEWNTGETTNIIENLSAGIYSCTLTRNDGGCHYEEFEVVNIAGNMEVSPYIKDNHCLNSDGYIELTVSGVENGYSVLWNTGETVNDIYQLSPGNYNVEITIDETGCLYTNSFNVETDMFTVTDTIQNSSCGICDDGFIDLTLEPEGLYSFEWSNGEISEDIFELLPNDYYVTITDEQCTETYYYTVSMVDSIENTGGYYFNCYPNPFTDSFFIDYDLKTENNFTVNIFDTKGKKLYTEKYSGKLGAKEIKTNSLTKGIYILEIVINNKSFNYKIVKN